MPAWLANRPDDPDRSQRPGAQFLGGGGGPPVGHADPRIRRVPNRPNRPNTPNRPGRGGGPDLGAWQLRNNYRPGGPGGPQFDPGSFGLDPGHDYGARRGNFLKSPIGRTWFEQNPEASYQLRLGQRGMPTDDTTAYGRWLAEQADSLYGDYQSTIGLSPNATWNKHLAGVMGDLETQYRTNPFQVRGDMPTVIGSSTWLGGW